ncbi:MAG: hypothetical protein HRT58_12655 [Crocinitomicaceae bacterium]|nr:THUMP domain-containing protein [Flavobacteriales bacterium]NQZ36514.1 hypothetical protein [Crocinitomicaceae bacterium]
MDMLGVEQKEGKMWITLKTIFGLEEVLCEELKEMGFEHVEILNRAVRVEGTWKDVYYLNLHVRCAISVLVEIKKFRIRNEEELYERCMKIKWTKYFTKDKTFAVKGAVFSEMFRHSQYPFLVVKDAIADTFRKEFDERPDVNIKAPQVMFDVYIRNNDVTISLNTSGLPLFQRGYREAVGLAPLNEVVAAGLIRMSGWDKKSTFVDPFCGSGTILIEAALMAAGLPPQMERSHFAFKNFANFQADVWEGLLADVPKRITELPCKIIGSDISADMVTKARRNFRGLSVGRFIETSVNSFQELTQVEGPGVMVSNPPYGERMGEEIEEMYEDLGNWMKGSMKGFSCWILSSNKEALKFVGLRPDRKIKVFNGDLECSFRKFSIYEGSKKGKYMDLDTEGNQEDPKEEFQGKKHDKVAKTDWVRSDRSKRLEKKPTERKSFDRDGSFDEKKDFTTKKPTVPRRTSDESDPKKEVATEPVIEKKSASSKYTKKEVADTQPLDVDKDKKSEPSRAAEETPSRKVVIEPVVEKRPASTKYAKKEEEVPAEPKVEAKSEESEPSTPKEKESTTETPESSTPKEEESTTETPESSTPKEEESTTETPESSATEKNEDSESKDAKSISSYKTRTVKDKYGRKD